jgi:hypothetical protein
VPQGDWVTDDAVRTNSGRRIFIERVASGALGTITWHRDPAATGLRITDCDATSDKEADVLFNEELHAWVVIRVHGAATDSHDLTCTDVIDVGIDDLCLLNGIKVTYSKDKAFTKIMWTIFDNAYEEVLWTLGPRPASGSPRCGSTRSSENPFDRDDDTKGPPSRGPFVCPCASKTRAVLSVDWTDNKTKLDPHPHPRQGRGEAASNPGSAPFVG